MNYYKQDNKVYQFNDLQVKQGIGEDFTPITEEEANELRTPTYTTEELEAQRVSQIREKANEIILAKYPDYKQRSGAMGVYGDDYCTEMKAFISGIVEQSNTLEADSTKTADDFVV